MSSADFYDALASDYDELFGVSDAGLEFVRAEGATAGRRVLDAACGTGAWTRALAREGVDVYGVDLSARMIERGRRIAREQGVDPDRLEARDMMRIDEHPRAPFALVSCVGNSIAHLASTGEVERFVRVAVAALGGAERPGDDLRSLVLQYVSVGSLEVGDAMELPPLRSPRATMRRTYRRTDPERIRFDASLEVAGSEPVSIAQDLLVLDDGAVAAMLASAGLRSVETYGGFDRTPVTNGTWVRVVRGWL